MTMQTIQEPNGRTYPTTNTHKNPKTGEALVNELQDIRTEQIPELVLLFEQLGSEDKVTVKKAEEELKYLEDKQISLLEIMHHSFPLWPIDAGALKKIATESSEASHPLLQARSFEACSYLVRNGSKEGYEAAQTIGPKKMRDPDEVVQKKGFSYFLLLLSQWNPELSPNDLDLAISIAKKIYKTDQPFEATRFFEKLVGNGKEGDIFKSKEPILGLCSSEERFPIFEVCSQLAMKKNGTLVQIPLEAASAACASEDGVKRHIGWNLFRQLLLSMPADTIDPLLLVLEGESKKENPERVLLSRLKELAGHDFSSLSQSSGDLILQRAKQDAPTLLRIVENLLDCKSQYVRDDATIFKQKLMQRMEEHTAN